MEEKVEGWKVVNPKKEKQKKKKEAGVGIKILKIILILVAILALAYVFIVIRNYILLQQITKKTAQYIGITNYSYEAHFYKENSGQPVDKMKVTRKDHILKIELGTNTKNLILWKNFNTNEGLLLLPETKICIVSDTDKLLLGELPLSNVAYANKWYQKTIALTSMISLATVEEQECYVLNSFGYQEWIHKETGLITKLQNSYLLEGKEEKEYTLYTNWKLNETTEEQVAKPDLTDYTLKR